METTKLGVDVLPPLDAGSLHGLTESFPAAFGLANRPQVSNSCVAARVCSVAAGWGKMLSVLDKTQPWEQERRTVPRFDMRLPAAIKAAEAAADELLTETQNVSARGVFFYLDRPLAEGSRIDVTVTFPPHITLTDAVQVRFAARVLRVGKPLPAFRFGIAALIEEHEFLAARQVGERPDNVQ